MIRRFELTDKQFAAITDLLPARGKRGGRWNDHRTTLNGIFWWLYTGAQWREAPGRYGKAKSIYDRFNFWRVDGTLDRILERLHLRLNKEGALMRRWLKENRQLATRHAKLAENYLATVKLAMIRRCLCLLHDPSDRTQRRSARSRRSDKLSRSV